MMISFTTEQRIYVSVGSLSQRRDSPSPGMIVMVTTNIFVISKVAIHNTQQHLLASRVHLQGFSIYLNFRFNLIPYA